MTRLFSSITLVFTFLVFGSFIQKTQSTQPIQIDVWEELEIFHQAIALTFHPAEDGDFKPVKNDSDELVEAAQKLSISKLPAYFEKNKMLKKELETTLQKLLKQSKELHNLVGERKGTNIKLLEELNNLHSIYHHIEELNNKAKKNKE